MKTQDAIKHAGSSANLAKLLGITPGAVSQWGEQIPDARIWQLKAIRPRWFKTSKPPKEVA
jgi:DNA-binding transcriptional regulator YdaS (Cro superfamily)